MNVSPFGKNQTIATRADGVQVFISYQTAVAAYDPQSGILIVTATDHSATTKRHISAFKNALALPAGYTFITAAQEVLDLIYKQEIKVPAQDALGTYVLRPGRSLIPVRNLGWLTRHQKGIKLVTVGARGTRGEPAPFMDVLYNDGTIFHAQFSCNAVLHDWIQERHFLSDVPVNWYGDLHKTPRNI